MFEGEKSSAGASFIFLAEIFLALAKSFLKPRFLGDYFKISPSHCTIGQA